MRLVILKDKEIKSFAMMDLQKRFSDFYHKHADIKPTFFIEEHDYSDVPTAVDPDGDIKPTDAYLRKWTKDVHRRYSGEGADHVVFLVHRDNWIFKGIWGQNWSNIFSGYQVELCRFDHHNMANSLGTLYHEVHHSHDAFIKVMTGVNVNKLLNVKSWDREITHGGEKDDPTWDYIRHTENAESLQYIAPYLRRAYATRKALYSKKVGMMQQVAGLLGKSVLLYRQLLNRKRGVV